MTTCERTTVNGIQLIHTYRGKNLEIDVYYHQDGPRTYNLFKKKEDREWLCDWVTSHSHREVALDADPTDLDAMLQAFTAMIEHSVSYRPECVWRDSRHTRVRNSDQGASKKRSAS